MRVVADVGAGLAVGSSLSGVDGGGVLLVVGAGDVVEVDVAGACDNVVVVGACVVVAEGNWVVVVWAGAERAAAVPEGVPFVSPQVVVKNPSWMRIVSFPVDRKLPTLLRRSML